MNYTTPRAVEELAVNSIGGEGQTGPAVITRLGDQVRGLIELRSRLRSVNKAIRGIQPTNEASKGEPPKPAELSLVDVARDIELLLEQCHHETSEMQSHLS